MCDGFIFSKLSIGAAGVLPKVLWRHGARDRSARITLARYTATAVRFLLADSRQQLSKDVDRRSAKRLTIWKETRWVLHARTHF